MKKIYKIFLIFFLMTTVALANIPSIHAISQTVNSGDLKQAHQMIEIVLKAHPKSAKAHYIDAQILVLQGNAQGAKHALKIARELEPNLPFVNQQNVIKLEQKIASLTHTHSTSHRSWIPWIILAIALLVLYFIWKNASKRKMSYQNNPSTLANHHNQNNPQTAQNSGGFGNGFFGNGIFGNIMSGLMMGAGFAAGERVVDNLMDSHDSNTDQTQTDLQNDNNQGYSDSTENDFGIDDSSSWDDGSSFGGDDFGGDDSSW